MNQGKLHAINVSSGGVPKQPREACALSFAGLEGDWQTDREHHGGPDRAVSLYSLEVIEKLRAEGHPISPGSTGENLTVSGMRPDGADTIFGGNGDLTARNTDGDGNHARDSDMILGDNGNIFRIVGINGVASGAPTFNYDNYQAGSKIVVRAAHLLDYTPGGPDLVPSSLATDLGAGDELHGESGDDFIYGMTGSDVMYGDSQDDDLIGGWGNDWISGGTGQDGVLGDDGRIFTSRNGTAEALYGITAVTASRITTPGNGLVVAEIEYRRWPAGGMVHQAAFKGVRTDKNPRQVVREDRMCETPPRGSLRQTGGVES